eukprot:TRINITY_DN66297_c0_g1_i1.p2 TRINITY_DN66297_c0_g1~~TRINITY_DN66297_c0_g1_i1.p2  ORF type:complete len:188 (-),score=23.20 TRINITY_DN66297_c0_g1_i1:41-604(-)
MGRLALVVFAAFVALLGVVATASQQPNGEADLAAAKTTLAQQGSFSTFLKLLRSSGFEPILARYIQTQPITLLAPVDRAFATLPLRVKSQLSGSKLIKLLEYHMILQKLPIGFLRRAQPGASFRTVYGVNLVKQRTALKNTVIFSPPGAVDAAQMAVITWGDLAAAKLILMSLHGTNAVLLPPNVFF